MSSRRSARWFECIIIRSLSLSLSSLKAAELGNEMMMNDDEQDDLDDE
jgi:hypothetical protein